MCDDAARTADGRLYHARGAATENDRATTPSLLARFDKLLKRRHTFHSHLSANVIFQYEFVNADLSVRGRSRRSISRCFAGRPSSNEVIVLVYCKSINRVIHNSSTTSVTQPCAHIYSRLLCGVVFRPTRIRSDVGMNLSQTAIGEYIASCRNQPYRCQTSPDTCIHAAYRLRFPL